MRVRYRHINHSDFAKENEKIAIINRRMTNYYIWEEEADV